MYTVKEDTTLVGVSELRTSLDRILKEAKFHKVIIEKRNKPIAVLMAIDRYNEVEAILDAIEDHELARIARQRERSASTKDYLPIEKIFKKVGR